MATEYLTSFLGWEHLTHVVTTRCWGNWICPVGPTSRGPLKRVPIPPLFPPICLSHSWSHSVSFHCSKSFPWDWLYAESCEPSQWITEPGGGLAGHNKGTCTFRTVLSSWLPSSLQNTPLSLVILLTVKPILSDISTTQRFLTGFTWPIFSPSSYFHTYSSCLSV